MVLTSNWVCCTQNFIGTVWQELSQLGMTTSALEQSAHMVKWSSQRTMSVQMITLTMSSTG
jgi:hypothetical protein